MTSTDDNYKGDNYTGDSWDPRAAEDLMSQTERAADAALTPDSKAMYLVWSGCWLVAMVAAYLGVRPDGPFSQAVGMTIYAIFIAIGLAFTMYAVGSKQHGLGGRTKRLGQLWGISWGVSWAAFALIIGGLARLLPDAQGGVIDTMAPVLATLIVGAMYLLGGAFWPASKMMLPGWLLQLVAGAATFFGPVNHYLVLGIGGAICFLIAAWRVATTESSHGSTESAAAMV